MTHYSTVATSRVWNRTNTPRSALTRTKYTFLWVFATRTFTTTAETEIQKQHKNNI